MENFRGVIYDYVPKMEGNVQKVVSGVYSFDGLMVGRVYLLVGASALEKPVIEGEMAVPRRPSGLRPPKTMFKPVAVGQVLEDGA